MICSKCGKTINDDSVFCAYCGANFRQLCKSCGAELMPGAVFCSKCGTTVSGAAAGNMPQADDDEFDFDFAPSAGNNAFLGAAAELFNQQAAAAPAKDNGFYGAAAALFNQQAAKAGTPVQNNAGRVPGENYMAWDKDFGMVCQTIRRGTLKSGIVYDEIESWGPGGFPHKSTPKSQNVMRKECAPLYKADGYGEIGAYTFERWFDPVSNLVNKGEMYYVLNDVIYGPGKQKFIDCKDAVNILWAANMLFITEVTDFTYKGREENEWMQGDYGYVHENYNVKLGLRVIDIPSKKEMLRVDGVDAIVGVNVEPDSNYQRWYLMDASQTKWVLDKTAWSFKRITSLKERLNIHNIPWTKVEGILRDIMMFDPSGVSVYNNKEHSTKYYKWEEL